MKKQDLESGMVVSLRDWKEKFILIGDTLCSPTGKDFLTLSSYDNDLKNKISSGDQLDIVEIYKCKYPNFMSCFIENKLELVWKREEIDWSKVPFGTRVRVWNDEDKKYEGKFLEYYKEDDYDTNPYLIYVRSFDNLWWKNCELIED